VFENTPAVTTINLGGCEEITGKNIPAPFFRRPVLTHVSAILLRTKRGKQCVVSHPSAFVSLGTFTGGIIRLISDIRLKHGSDAVKLSEYGRFVLADDLSDIADMTHIDLSGISSLEGACVRFCLFSFRWHFC
jgi:hypothetical protein